MYAGIQFAVDGPDNSGCRRGSIDRRVVRNLMILGSNGVNIRLFRRETQECGVRGLLPVPQLDVASAPSGERRVSSANILPSHIPLREDDVRGTILNLAHGVFLSSY